MKQGKKIISGGHFAPQACASTEDRQRMIVEAAYYRALARGFAPGCEVEDWLQAEAEINHRLARVRRAHPGRALRISG